MGPFEGASLKRKLTLINVVSAAAALLLACAAFATYELVTFRGSMIRSLSTQAQIVGSNAASAILFADPDAAAVTLGALRAEPHVVWAGIYFPDGRPFASYVRSDSAASVPSAFPRTTDGQAFERGRLLMERLGDDARRLLAAAGAGGTHELSAVIAVWRDCVGEVIARAAWPGRISRDGTLHVATASSA